MIPSVRAFTVKYDHIENVLTSDIGVDNPFNPQTTVPPQFGHKFSAI